MVEEFSLPRYSTPPPPPLIVYCSLILLLISLTVSSLHRSRTDSDIEILSPQPGMLAGDGLEVIPEQPDQILDLSGPLLRRDDKFRWHRSFCRISPTEKSLLVYESPEETQCLYTLQLEGAKVVFNPEDSDRENCFILTLSSVDLQQTPTSTTGLYHMERYFAAYSEPEFKQWKVTLEGLLSTSRRTNTLSILSTGDSFFETTGDMDRNGLPPPPPPLPGMVRLSLLTIEMLVCLAVSVLSIIIVSSACVLECDICV